MDPFVAEIVHLFRTELKVEAIVLLGSQVDRAETDYWSDIDMTIVLASGQDIEKDQIVKATHGLGQLICKEEFETQEVFSQRLVLLRNKKIERVDVKTCTLKAWRRIRFSAESRHRILYGSPLEINRREDRELFGFGQAEKERTRIHNIWFLFFECVKKFMRNDNLIGLHLLLDLVREYLVLRMQERDVKYQTNIHKKGNREQLPQSIEFDQLAYQSKQEVLTYLKSLATEIDQELRKQYEGYESRLALATQYLQESEQNIAD
ncbi:MAG: hypothetical protein AAF587_43535 [Bacteroidota bacterium]